MLTYSVGVIIMSVLTFIVYGIDKFKAVHHNRRISERTLFILAFFLGSLGAIIATILFKHKSNKLKFKIFNALFFIAHILLGVYLYIHL